MQLNEMETMGLLGWPCHEFARLDVAKQLMRERLLRH